MSENARVFNRQWRAGTFGRRISARNCKGLALPDIPPERPVLIAGPTASGKSALAQRIVAGNGGVIINADALQVYGCWRVLTARPTPAEEAALPHRL